MIEKISYAVGVFFVMVALGTVTAFIERGQRDEELSALNEKIAALEYKVANPTNCSTQNEAVKVQAAMIVSLVEILDRHGISVVLVEEGGALEVAPLE